MTKIIAPTPTTVNSFVEELLYTSDTSRTHTEVLLWSTVIHSRASGGGGHRCQLHKTASLLRTKQLGSNTKDF